MSRSVAFNKLPERQGSEGEGASSRTRFDSKSMRLPRGFPGKQRGLRKHRVSGFCMEGISMHILIKKSFLFI